MEHGQSHHARTVPPTGPQFFISPRESESEREREKERERRERDISFLKLHQNQTAALVVRYALGEIDLVPVVENPSLFLFLSLSFSLSLFSLSPSLSLSRSLSLSVESKTAAQVGGTVCT